MNTIYVAYLDQINQDDLVLAKQIGSDDRLLLLTGTDPYMPCDFYYYLRDLNVEPEFATFENSMLITGFMLGLQCANHTGKIIIISSDESYNEMNDCTFSATNGKISVSVFPSFSDAFDASEKKETNKASSKESKNIKEDAADYPPASDKFKKKLDDIDTKHFALSNNADCLAHCIRESADQTPGTLKMLLTMQFDEKTAKAISPILEDHFDELLSLAL